MAVERLLFRAGRQGYTYPEILEVRRGSLRILVPSAESTRRVRIISTVVDLAYIFIAGPLFGGVGARAHAELGRRGRRRRSRSGLLPGALRSPRLVGPMEPPAPGGGAQASGSPRTHRHPILRDVPGNPGAGRRDGGPCGDSGLPVATGRGDEVRGHVDDFFVSMLTRDRGRRGGSGRFVESLQDAVADQAPLAADPPRDGDPLAGLCDDGDLEGHVRPVFPRGRD